MITSCNMIWAHHVLHWKQEYLNFCAIFNVTNLLSFKKRSTKTAEFDSHYIKAVRENLWLGFDLVLTTEHRHIYKTRNYYVLILFPRCAAGKQLLPLSSSMHGGVSQLAWQQHSGEPNNLVRMRSQSFGQSAPSLTAGLVSACAPHMCTNPLYLFPSNTSRCKHRVQNYPKCKWKSNKCK